MRAWLQHNRFLLVFALLASLMGTSVGVAKIVTSIYALHLGASAAQFGLIAAGQSVGVLVMSLPVGLLVDRHGPARLFVLGSVLAGLAYALVPLVASPWFLLGCVIAISFFMPLRFVSLNTLFFQQIRQLGEGKAGWYRGTHMTGMYLVGPSLGVALVAWAGFAATWWLVAASFALTIAVSPIVFGRYAPPRHASERIALRGMGDELARLLRDAELRETCLVDFFAQGTTMLVSTFVVAVALQRMRLDAAHASAFVTGSGVAFIAMLMGGGSLSVRLGLRRSYVLGFVLAAAGLCLLGLAPGAAWLWAGVVLQGLGLGLLQIVTLTRIARIGPRLGQGKVSGANSLTGPLGALSGSIVGGLIGEALGLQAVFFLFVPAYLLLAVWQLQRRSLLSTKANGLAPTP